MAGPLFLFAVLRPCRPGFCSYPENDRCACDPEVLVDVDELTDVELAHFKAHGTPEQQAEISGWLDEQLDPAELLAGQRDPLPELVRA